MLFSILLLMKLSRQNFALTTINLWLEPSGAWRLKLPIQ